MDLKNLERMRRILKFLCLEAWWLSVRISAFLKIHLNDDGPEDTILSYVIRIYFISVGFSLIAIGNVV